jgi:hypothetical protein
MSSLFENEPKLIAIKAIDGNEDTYAHTAPYLSIE